MVFYRGLDGRGQLLGPAKARQMQISQRDVPGERATMFLRDYCRSSRYRQIGEKRARTNKFRQVEIPVSSWQQVKLNNISN